MRQFGVLAGVLCLLLAGCDQVLEKDETTGFSKGFTTVKSKTDSYLAGGLEQQAIARSAKNVVRIKNREQGGGGVILSVEVPHNLRGDELKKYLKNTAMAEIKGAKSVMIRAAHVGVATFSGVIATYHFFNGGKPAPKFHEVLTREAIKQRGIEHYLLEYDYQVLTMVEEVLKQLPAVSLDQLAGEIAKKRGVSAEYIKKLITFGARYYQSDLLKNLN